MKEIKINGVIGSWDADPQEIVYEIENANDDITAHIDSVGGSVIGGFSIANAIEDHKAKGYKFDIVGGGVVASIASYIAMKGTSFTIRDNTTFMIHNAWLPIAGDFNALRKAADLSEGLSSIIAKSYSKKTKIDDKKIKEMMNEETFLFGDEITAGGFADEIKENDEQISKSEALALTIESIKACNNAVMTNEKVSFEAVAQFVPTKQEESQQKADEEEPQAKSDSKHKRNIALKILGA